MKADVPSLAMGDITFNLIIFFVILAAPKDDHVQWEPASAKNLQKPGQPSRVSITIDREGKLYLNGQPRSESALGGDIEELLGDAPAGERLVFLKVDKEATAPRFEPVIEAISKAGGELMHILSDQGAAAPVPK
jgi:biopolymer transport protein ExbD